MKNKGYANFGVGVGGGGGNKVHYGKCGSGVLKKITVEIQISLFQARVNPLKFVTF